MNYQVTTIIATRDRPDMLREAIASVVDQEGVDGLEVVVVFDRSDPDYTLEMERSTVTVRVIENSRKPGLAGARNSGISVARGEYIAFCDDDDYWLPGKLAAQVNAFKRRPDSGMVSCGILVEYGSARHERVLKHDQVTYEHLLRDRITELHPSTFLFRATALREEIGLVSEDVPGGFGEDYELLLRTARVGPIISVQRPYTVVRWHQSSFFFQRWEMMSAGLQYVITVHPEITANRRGHARIQGQIAFAEASKGSRGVALKRMARAVRSSPLEPRIYLAGLVATGLLKPATVMTTLHRFGRGI